MYRHIPVMADEIAEYLELKPGKLIVDCTVGCGGHASRILKEISPGGTLIGIDTDDEALKIAEEYLKPYKGSFRLIHNNFRNLGSILKDTGINKIDGLLFDLGVSSVHFDTPSRGFSLKHDGPLDMRMDRRSRFTAARIVNNFPYEELEKILREYGEEARSRKIARAIIDRRKKRQIRTTLELSRLIEDVHRRPRHTWRIHPATKVFLALRIAVNDELEALKEGLASGVEHLKSGSRIAVISFHSLEDRIVKRAFREYRKEKILNIITKSPLRPDGQELERNPRARSAKLRIAERT